MYKYGDLHTHTHVYTFLECVYTCTYKYAQRHVEDGTEADQCSVVKHNTDT